MPPDAPQGLSSREAARRLAAHGRNELVSHSSRAWPRELAEQFVHPLALLLIAAGVLALAAGIVVLAIAIAAVVVLNAALAFWQEQQAEHAVEALRAYMPAQAMVLRDGERTSIDAAELVPGDLMVLLEGDRISADAQLVSGSLEVDMSALSGESLPVVRRAGAAGSASPLDAEDLVFSGTAVTGGEARALVTETGMQTQIGHVAALTQHVEAEESPLTAQVRRVAWLIAVIAVGVGLAFVPIGVLAAGLSIRDAVVFAIGLLVANVPEGLLPTITLALAAGVGALARRGAIVKRLSAVETLGSTDVICTDKTGTLTENRMRVTDVWPESGPARDALAAAVARCNDATLEPRAGDPTELALLELAHQAGQALPPSAREQGRLGEFRFDAARKLMTTIDDVGGEAWAHVKGAPDVLLERCGTRLDDDGAEVALTDADRAAIEARFSAWAGRGLRVLAAARRRVEPAALDAERDDVEAGLCLLGLAGMLDPPRAEVPDAVAACHAAGIRIHVVTGDHPLTAQAIARRVGIGDGDSATVTGAQLDAMSEDDLDALLGSGREVIFARTSPEAKLRIADALDHLGHVVAMTGDGVNDAPALRRAHIGVAMGRGGTEVAREASTMVLTDDDFATIAAAVEEGRRVYENIRKFVLYIFAHAPAEIVPFLVFALSGGAIPLPLTAAQILAIDLGTETLPALALGREAAEPGVMSQPPRRRSEGVIGRALLFRAWAFLGLVSAALVMGGFLYVMLRAGWRPGDDTGSGSPLHDAYRRATAMTFAGIVACQLGTAMAARTERASLRTVGVLRNRLLLWGMAFEIAFAAAVVYAPGLQEAFGTRGLRLDELALLLPFPLIVWGADELRRARRRRRRQAR